MELKRKGRVFGEQKAETSAAGMERTASQVASLRRLMAKEGVSVGSKRLEQVDSHVNEETLTRSPSLQLYVTVRKLITLQCKQA
jgi:hypothetical protein